jgi:hypothetical protein
MSDTRNGGAVMDFAVLRYGKLSATCWTRMSATRRYGI